MLQRTVALMVTLFLVPVAVDSALGDDVCAVVAQRLRVATQSIDAASCDDCATADDWQRAALLEALEHNKCESPGVTKVMLRPREKVGARGLPQSERVSPYAELVRRLLDVDLSLGNESPHPPPWAAYDTNATRIAALRDELQRELLTGHPQHCPPVVVSGSAATDGGASVVLWASLLRTREHYAGLSTQRIVDDESVTKVVALREMNRSLAASVFVRVVAEVMDIFAANGFRDEVDAGIIDVRTVYDPDVNAEAWCAPQPVVPTPPQRRFQSVITFNTARPVTLEKMQQLVAHEVTHHIQFVALALHGIRDPSYPAGSQAPGGILAGATFPPAPDEVINSMLEQEAAMIRGGKWSAASNLAEQYFAELDDIYRQRNDDGKGGRTPRTTHHKPTHAGGPLRRFSAMSLVLEGAAETAVDELIFPHTLRVAHLTEILIAAGRDGRDGRSATGCTDVEGVAKWLLRMDRIKQELSWREVVRIARLLHEDRLIDYDDAVHRLRDEALVPQDSWPTAAFLLEHGAQHAATYSVGKVIVSAYIAATAASPLSSKWRAFAELARRPRTPRALQRVVLRRM